MRWLLLLAAVLVGVLALWSVPADEASLERSNALEHDLPPLPERAPVLEGVLPSSSAGEPPAERLVPTTGRVLWPDGTPYRSSRSHLTVLDKRGRLIAPSLDAEGRFRFDAPRGADRLMRLGQTDARSVLHVCHWEVEGGTQDLELRIPASADTPFAAFRVEDHKGRLVPDAKLTLHVLGEFGASIERVCRVRDGWARVVMEMAARRVVVCVSHAVDREGKRLAGQAFGPIPLGGEPSVLRLEPARVWRARVVDETGESIEGVSVALDLLPPILNWVGPFHATSAKTDGEGRVTVEGLGRERYRLNVTPPQPWMRPVSRVTRIDSEETRIVLRRGVMARVRVVDPEEKPLSSCEIGVSPDNHVRRWWTAEDGGVLVGPVEAGVPHRLWVAPPRKRTRERRIRAQAERARLRLGPATWAPVLLERTVKDWVPKDTTVRLAYDEEPLPAPPPGISESGPEHGGACLRVRIRTPKPDDLGDLPEGELTREDRAGEDAREVSFAIGYEWAEDVRRYAVTEHIHDLDPDATYRLRVAGIQDGWALEARGLEPGPTLHDLKLERGLVIGGRLVLPPDTDYVSIDATCGRLRVMGSFAGATVLPDGRFEIPGLVSGVWRVDFTARASGEWYGAEVDVEAGDEVVVRLEPSR